MPDMFTKEKRSEIMAKIRSKGTKIELKMKAELDKNQIEYKYQPKIFGNPDFLIPPNIVIFCDSSFWHARNWNKLKKQLSKKYWYGHIKKNRLRDRIVNAELRNRGYFVLRFWDTQIEKQMEKCIKQIEEIMQSHKTQTRNYLAKSYESKNMAGTFWLCPIKQKSWRIIKKYGVYGVPCNRKNKLDALEIGDFLVIYVYPPVRGILGICKVTSRPYEDDEPLWGKVSGFAKYRCRIRVKIIPHYTFRTYEVVPLYKILGFENAREEYSVEPYLHGILFIKLSNDQRRTLLNELAKKTR